MCEKRIERCNEVSWVRVQALKRLVPLGKNGSPFEVIGKQFLDNFPGFYLPKMLRRQRVVHSLTSFVFLKLIGPLTFEFIS